jgi:protein-export membrane protein SecD
MRNKYFLLALVIVLTLAAGFFDYPEIWDRGAAKFNGAVPYPKLPNFPKRPFRLGLDLAGGTHLVYQADVSKVPSADQASALAGLRDVIERRVNRFGVSEPLVQIEQGAPSIGGGSTGNWRLAVELAGVHDARRAVATIGETPYLEFQELGEAAEQEAAGARSGTANDRREAAVNSSGEAVIEPQSPFKPTELTGRFLKRAELTFDPTAFQPQVRLVFDSEGARLFKEITARNINKPIAIVVDGVVISAPRVEQSIEDGEAVITGISDQREARSLAENLKAGALPVPITLISQQNIGAILGEESLRSSLSAGLMGLALVAAFMLFWYRAAGFAAVVTLCIYGILTLALFKAVGVVLTLAGIAGFILSLGMAVDGNILTFERLREELGGGRPFPDALHNAVRRSWPSVRDGQFTTLLIAIILFFFGTSLVKGFGLTLAMGVALSVGTSMGLTPLFLRFIERTRLAKIRWLWG